MKKKQQKEVPKKDDGLVLSFSMMDKMLKCEQAYYYTYIRELEQIAFNRAFIIGEMQHHAVHFLLAKDADAEKKVSKLFDEKIQEIRQSLQLTLDDEQQFVEDKNVVIGMLRGYAARYKRDLQQIKHIENEYDRVYPLYDIGDTPVSIRIKIDNIVVFKNRWLFHELKTVKTLTPDYVDNTKRSLQIALYYHVHNMMANLPKKQRPEGIKPFSGIMYDVIQKPSIRKKKDEQYKAYLKRLEEYYTGAEASSRFFKEVMDAPAIRSVDAFNTMTGCAKRMIEMKGGREPIKTYNGCGWCEFSRLCYEGESKQNLSMYRKRVRLEYKKEGK